MRIQRLASHACPGTPVLDTPGGNTPDPQPPAHPAAALLPLLAAVYSMVKFGGVRNYIVAAWDPGDLAACADLNLPCADVAAFLPEPMDRSRDAGLTGSHDYLVGLAGCRAAGWLGLRRRGAF